MPRIVQCGVTTEGLRKEFCFRDRRDGSTSVMVKERMGKLRGKVGGDIFGKMPEVTGSIRKSKVLTLSIYEIVFGKSENRFGTIPAEI